MRSAVATVSRDSHRIDPCPANDLPLAWGQVSIMNTDRLNRFRLRTIAAPWLCLAILGSGCSSNSKTGLHSSGGTTTSGGTTAQGGSMVNGGSTGHGGNGGTTGTGGVSSSGGGVSCYDASGAIATTAKTCTLASDCRQAVRPACCGAVLEVGLAKASSCTFPTPSCENFACPIYLPIYLYPPEQAEDGKDAAQGGSIGVECVSGQCMTFVMAGGVDAAADATGGATSAGGGAGSGGTQAAGGATGTGGSTSTSDGSTTDLDTCSSDADCTSCNWGEAPTDSSHCTGTYCCGGPISSKKRCDANQAAWETYCPGQSPTLGNCACLGCTGQSIGCVNGQCGLWCHFPDAG
jgi:hypothetical protein